MTTPRYQDVKSSDIPEITDDDGTRVRVIVGDFWGQRGPVDGIAADPQYLDIWVPAGVKKSFPVDTYRRSFAYVFEGAGAFADASEPTGVLLEKEVAGREVHIRDLSGDRTLIRFGTGDRVTVQAGEDGVRFLLVSGAPIQEPVAWHGPIVMNTKDELRQAMRELRDGSFIK
jgi:redox-sensitive bicupin YhaK (pirin superfamily)